MTRYARLLFKQILNDQLDAVPECGAVTPARDLRPQTCDLLGGSVARRMKKIDYDGYHFPHAIIQQGIVTSTVFSAHYLPHL
jgi:hypothetical protein